MLWLEKYLVKEIFFLSFNISEPELLKLTVGYYLPLKSNILHSSTIQHFISSGYNLTKYSKKK